MSTTQWLSVIFTLLGAGVSIAVVWGSLKNEVGNLRTMVTKLEADLGSFKEKHGERLGKVETKIQLVKQATSARGVRTTPVDSPEE